MQEGYYDILDDRLDVGRLTFRQKGEEKRIFIKDAQVAAVMVHRVRKTDKITVLTRCKGEEGRCPYCAEGDIPSARYCVLVYVYHQSKGGWTVKDLVPWVFGRSVLSQLRTHCQKLSLTLRSRDWIVRCTNPTFQTVTVTPAQDVLGMKSTALKAEMVRLAKECSMTSLDYLRSLVGGTEPEAKPRSAPPRAKTPPPAKTSPPPPAKTPPPPPETPPPPAGAPPPPPPETTPPQKTYRDWEAELDAILGND